MKRLRVCIASALLLLATWVSASEPIGVVLSTQGNVLIERDGGSLSAIRKASLFEHDIIQTTTLASVEIRLADGTVTALGENTRFVIDQFVFNQSHDTNRANFNLLTGSLRTISGQLLEQPGSDFTVNTPVGVLGIRGTEFWCGYLEGQDNVDVLLIEGTHALEVKNTNGAVFLNHAGEGTTLRKDRTKPVVKVWPKEKVEKALKKVKAPQKTDNATPNATSSAHSAKQHAGNSAEKGSGQQTERINHQEQKASAKANQKTSEQITQPQNNAANNGKSKGNSNPSGKGNNK